MQQNWCNRVYVLRGIGWCDSMNSQAWKKAQGSSGFFLAHQRSPNLRLASHWRALLSRTWSFDHLEQQAFQNGYPLEARIWSIAANSKNNRLKTYWILRIVLFLIHQVPPMIKLWLSSIQLNCWLDEQDNRESTSLVLVGVPIQSYFQQLVQDLGFLRFLAIPSRAENQVHLKRPSQKLSYCSCHGQIRTWNWNFLIYLLYKVCYLLKSR